MGWQVERNASRGFAIAAVLVLGCAAQSDESGDGGQDESSESGATSSTAADQTSGGSDSDDGSSDTGSAGEPAAPSDLPTPTGTCPALADGDAMFSPAGIEPRAVRLWMSDAASGTDSPLIFYWHGTGSAPQEALVGLNTAFVQEFVAQGGIVAAPHSDPASGQFPWYLTTGNAEDDLLVADEVLGCANEALGIDARRIHSIGMSAGGLQTSQMAFRRSGYIASVVAYSGGLLATPPPDQDPENPFAAMLFHGGPDDIVIISFQSATESYLDLLGQTGRFGFICDHGNGHTIPQAQASVWQFFLDHPYGTTPPPYQAGLPAGFPDYCSL